MNKIKIYNSELVKQFLSNEKVSTRLEIEKRFDKAKILSVNPKQNISFFGVFDNLVVLPKITDPISCLINIHEMVHLELLEDKYNNLDDNIVYGEDLPIFYELLFKKRYGIQDEIHVSETALKLLNDYKNEPFEEQIKKLKK